MAFGYDPTLSAYLRTMGVEEQNIYAEARERSNMAQRGYTRTQPMWAEKERSAVQNVTDDAETRGVYFSGAMLKNAARARAGVQMEQGEARAQAADTATAYSLDAARRIAALRQGATEAGLDARSRAVTAGLAATYG